MSLLKSILGFIFLISILSRCTNNSPSSPIKPKTNPPSSLSEGKAAFIKWGKKSACSFDIKQSSISDSLLQKIADDISDSKVVLLSEGFHNCQEMLQLQSQLIPYLIEKKGFNIVVTESGLPESKYMNDYIHGKDSIPNLWEKSVGKMYIKWKMGRKTIESLRKHNQSSTQKVDYIGADIGGFYNNWHFPFQQIFAYIDSVNAPLSRSLQKDMVPYFKVMTKYAAYHYGIKLSSTQKNNLMVILDNLIDTFYSNQELYISKSNSMDYQWILQCIKSMQMAENYYRNYSDANDTVDNHSKYVGLNGREIAMAKNIQWILSTKKEAKIIVVNHVVHTKTATQYQEEMYGHFTPMGQLLKQNLKKDLFVIGMVYGGGHFWNKWQVPSRRFVDTIPSPLEGGLESVMQAIYANDYYLNLEHTPVSTYLWFKENTMLRENDYEIKIRPVEWNACFFLNEVNPAEPVDSFEAPEPPYEG